MNNDRTNEEKVLYLKRKLISLDMAISGTELAKDLLQQQFDFTVRQIEKLQKEKTGTKEKPE